MRLRQKGVSQSQIEDGFFDLAVLKLYVPQHMQRHYHCSIKLRWSEKGDRGLEEGVLQFYCFVQTKPRFFVCFLFVCLLLLFFCFLGGMFCFCFVLTGL